MDKYEANSISNFETCNQLYLYLLYTTSAHGHVVVGRWDELEPRPWSLISD